MHICSKNIAHYLRCCSHQTIFKDTSKGIIITNRLIIISSYPFPFPKLSFKNSSIPFYSITMYPYILFSLPIINSDRFFFHKIRIMINKFMIYIWSFFINAFISSSTISKEELYCIHIAISLYKRYSTASIFSLYMIKSNIISFSFTKSDKTFFLFLRLISLHLQLFYLRLIMQHLFPIND